MDVPTTIHKDTICYSEKTVSNNWRPRDDACYATCMAYGVAATATKAAGVDVIVDLAVEGLEASSQKIAGKALQKYFLHISVGKLTMGTNDASQICDAACR